MRDSFANIHPINNLIFFALVIGFALLLGHPLALAVSLVCACAYAISTEGKKSVLFLVKYCLPTVLLTAIINPVFNHEGATILLFFSNGNPLTLESILYGLSSGVMLVTVLTWFMSFNRVMTSDKLIYLFGRIIPSLSLVISMTLRFVPKFKQQMESVAEAQKSIGRDVSNGNIFGRARTAVHIFSIMITWSLENAIETADSMKSRGYGLKGRTAFAIYRFDKRDKFILAWFAFCFLCLAAGVIASAFDFGYFPSISYAAIDASTIPFYCIYFALCITPVVINIKEERRWKTLALKT